MTISICGCGWLGHPLARSLQSAGHQVVASKRHFPDKQAFVDNGIRPVSFTLGQALDTPELVPLLSSNYLVLNIPPGQYRQDITQFVQLMCELIDAAKACGTQQLIFVSTTAVYGDTPRTCYEYSEPLPVTASGKAHLQIEQHVQQQFSDKACILRLSGLVGEQRHPAFHLAGRNDVKQGDKPVNLIHQSDVIAAITAIIEQDLTGRTLHLSSQEHPDRAQYYSWACSQLSLAPPQFSDRDLAQDDKRLRGNASRATGALINSDLTLNILNLILNYPSPFDMLPDKTERNKQQ